MVGLCRGTSHRSIAGWWRLGYPYDETETSKNHGFFMGLNGITHQHKPPDFFMPFHEGWDSIGICHHQDMETTFINVTYSRYLALRTNQFEVTILVCSIYIIIYICMYIYIYTYKCTVMESRTNFYMILEGLDPETGAVQWWKRDQSTEVWCCILCCVSGWCSHCSLVKSPGKNLRM